MWSEIYIFAWKYMKSELTVVDCHGPQNIRLINIKQYTVLGTMPVNNIWFHILFYYVYIMLFLIVIVVR